MRRGFSFLPLLLCACGAQDSMTNNGANSTGAGTAASDAPAASAPATPPVQTASLTGLYEGGTAGRRNQMCVIERAGREARFGLVVWGAGSEGCSGAGAAVRQGDALRLAMSGDEACTIEARVEGTRVTFPATLPAGCSYYCSRGARFAGASFDKTGGTADDALRAEDLVGDRLCAGAR
ncbi:MAG TPA: hypothetical protein VEW25_01120 [Allosphingosinicella sp.]|nr:hypothetical protein [Allosphingosinicella sp.]